MPEITLHKITDGAAIGPCDELFREYGNWSAGLLSSEYGLAFTPAELEAVHGQFRSEWPVFLSERGRLYLVLVDEAPAGVGVLKPINAAAVELKRMYVRPGHRRQGIARLLLTQLMEDARDIGYATMRLETVKFMAEAHELYRSVGFVEVEPFDAEGTDLGLGGVELFMECAL